MKDSLDVVQKKLESFPVTSDADNLSRMDEMLKTLEEVSELAAKMLDSERERVLNRVMTYRRRLLGSMVEKLAVDLVFQEEEKAIKELCGDDEAAGCDGAYCSGLIPHSRLSMSLKKGYLTVTNSVVMSRYWKSTKSI